MALIDVKDMSFKYDGGSDAVFDNVSFRLDTDWKLGLVGRNGRGKTTLLKILAGKYEYTGKITSGVGFEYFPYEVRDPDMPAYEIVRELCPDAEDWETVRELSYMQTDASILDRRFSVLSGGEKTKILLCCLFLNPYGFPLIDEPTDHLDIDGRAAVAKYLRGKKGFIVVSHDRTFLDGCVDHIMSINKTDTDICSGNFSVWYENFVRRQAQEAADNDKLKKEIAKLSEAVRRTSDWADKTEASKFGKASSGLKPDRGYVGHKAAKLMKQAKNAENRLNKAVEIKSGLFKNAETCDSLKLNALDHRSECLIELKDVRIVYDGKPVNEPLDLKLMRGERIALDGRNGCGKSSVLKAIMGLNSDHTGTIRTASGLVISYVPQTSEHLHGGLSEFAKNSGVDESLFKTVLRKMGFERRDFDGDVAEFSAGQKKKVMIAKSLCEKAHVYIWDEPLNFIDIFSRMQIEKLLDDFRPSMLFTEHDKAFRNAIATITVTM